MLKPEDKKPHVEPFHFYVEAFNELSTCRSNGFGISAIPFVAVVEYAKLYGITGEDFSDLLYIIRTMDAELIRLESTKQKAPTNGNKTSKRNPRQN